MGHVESSQLANQYQIQLVAMTDGAGNPISFMVDKQLGEVGEAL